MQTAICIRNGCRKSITQWYSLTWEMLQDLRGEEPDLIDELATAIDNGDKEEIWNISESILENEEIRDSARLKLDHWEIEYGTIKVQPLPADQFTEEEFEPEFGDIGFPFKTLVKDWGTSYEVCEGELFEQEIKSKVCILFYTYDNRCKYDYLVETSEPFDLTKFSYEVEKHQDGSFSGRMTYDGEAVTENWEGSGDECDGVFAVYASGELIRSMAN